MNPYELIAASTNSTTFKQIAFLSRGNDKLKWWYEIIVGADAIFSHQPYASTLAYYKGVPELLLLNYLSESGKDIFLNRTQMLQINAEVDLKTSKSFLDVVEMYCAASKNKKLNFIWNGKVHAVAKKAKTLGGFKTDLSLIVSWDGCSWNAKGSISFYDWWDFDKHLKNFIPSTAIKDWIDKNQWDPGSRRPFSAEMRVLLMNGLSPGKPFNVFSEKISFEQSLEDKLGHIS